MRNSINAAPIENAVNKQLTGSDIIVYDALLILIENMELCGWSFICSATTERKRDE